jgi:hypothetical protein
MDSTAPGADWGGHCARGVNLAHSPARIESAAVRRGSGRIDTVLFASARTRFVLACLTAGVAWVAMEVGGGLAFLYGGIRLWRYRIVPILDDITSPVVWVFAVALIVPLGIAFDRWVAFRWQGMPRQVVRLAFLMTVGPILEVAINRWLFEALCARPLYEYTVLPTFSGSGSWLSPLYYATLIVHVPITDRLLWAHRPGAPGMR